MVATKSGHYAKSSTKSPKAFNNRCLAGVSSVTTISLLITSCGIINSTRVSKDCDDLASKFLSASQSQASVNGGLYAKSIITVSNAVPAGRGWSKGKVTQYSISPSGKTNAYSYSGFTNEENPNTMPEVATDEQIACQYKQQYIVPVLSKNDSAPSPYVFIYLKTRGENYMVTEDKNGIRWRECAGTPCEP